MKQRVIYVMTHDSIGLGEDGPTHQPVEHISSLRAIPDLYVFRPADAIETLESWGWAVAQRHAPSLMALSRQNLPALRITHTQDNLVSRGGYVLREASSTPKAVLLATGSEVHLAVEACDILEQSGIPTRVVSMPCFELFDEQPSHYQDEVLGDDSVIRVAVEAGIRMSWDKYIGRKGIFIGMNSFGASAPAPELYKHFDITTEAIVNAVKAKL
jgi:transketolase